MMPEIENIREKQRLAEVERIARMICEQMNPGISPELIMSPFEPCRLRDGGFEIPNPDHIMPLWKRYWHAASAVVRDRNGQR